MAVNKRLRFEVLRRDGFRCTYCGATPAEAELHIDHVVPVALGGTDIPENLTTACADCNEGKASTTASAEMVAAVDRAIAVEAAARQRVENRLLEYADGLDVYEDEINAIWDYYVPEYRRRYAKRIDVMRIADWYDMKIPVTLVEFAVRIAVQADVPWQSKAAYAVAIVRNKTQEAREADGA
jgi:hypothetical protein